MELYAGDAKLLHEYVKIFWTKETYLNTWHAEEYNIQTDLKQIR